jgi:CHRD domain/PEP-CTERM motif
MKALCATLLACAGMIATVTPIKADFISTATLTPGADGAITSTGSGNATVNYNSAADIFTYTLSWADLTGPAIMAHIHLGPPGVEGPILIPFFMSMMPATDTISGTLTQADVTPADGVGTIAQVASAIEAGNAYVNVHTPTYPAGEIRGQLAVTSTSTTPEPSTTGLLLLSFGGTAGFLYLRRRANSKYE